MAEQPEQFDDDDHFEVACGICDTVFVEGTCRVDFNQYAIVPGSIQMQTSTLLLAGARVCRECKGCCVCAECAAADPHMTCPVCHASEDKLIPMRVDLLLANADGEH